ncbi:16S rRNA (cytosine(1402)-N(4))-methyltransferase RsmH [Acuticoccus sp.]|uniref:16S rRNA (cytosine(1402)-N(4))-methyltransferase RsmH n=1 Tax=Acuticoccus sp. TaxID=1904378 RepID=UPI003B529127
MTWDDAPPPHGATSGSATSGARHVPVMLGEVMVHLSPQPDAVVVDGTFGGGGYARAILATGASVVAIDRDPAAVHRASALAEEQPKLIAIEGRFGDMAALVPGAGIDAVDGVVLDVGVSSFQLAEGARGFSFRLDGPLDMRMGGEGPSAADIVNRADVADLAHLLRTFGEERHAGRVARAIVAARPLSSTGELAALCERVLRATPGLHPATRTFQALRIAVNDELGELGRGLAAAERLLREGGRLVVVAFHSLEDRLVKRFLAARSGEAAGSRHLPAVGGPEASFVPVGRRAVGPSAAEAAANPRARSAKLRAARRTAAPAVPFDPSLVPVVRLKGVL